MQTNEDAALVKAIIRSCVVCRKKEAQAQLLRFYLDFTTGTEEGFKEKERVGSRTELNLNLSGVSKGRSVYCHSRCLTDRNLLSQLKASLLRKTQRKQKDVVSPEMEQKLFLQRMLATLSQTVSLARTQVNRAVLLEAMQFVADGEPERKKNALRSGAKNRRRGVRL